ncbi:polynucleotide adenylyltransferase PcnB, partial [Acinetobacter baumannii]|nr:polynucleotide adenylyltransferase PcnB [Acinetobacter baumannii]
RSRRGKKERARQEQSIDRFIEKSSAAQTNVMSDHPILKRKRVQRDLSQVIFGPTQ